MAQLLNVIGPYRILKRLGRGGMGDVLLAEDTRIDAGAAGRRVALKVLWRDLEKDSPGVLEAEKQGAQLQARLYAIDHRVARVNEWGELDDVFFIDMEYVEGQDLAELIYTGPLDPRVAAQIACEIADILSRAHTLRFEHLNRDSRGVIHGDIKPRNIRIEPSGRVRLFDFGIAKALSATRKLTRNEFGSVSYASPERLDTGDVNEHSDLWSLGVVLFEMLAGHPPFDSDNTRKIERRILDGDGPDALPPLVPSPLRELVSRCLARKPEHRFQSAAQLRDALKTMLSGVLKESASAEHTPVKRPGRAEALDGEDDISLERVSSPTGRHTDEAHWETAATGEVPPAARTSRSQKHRKSLQGQSDDGDALGARRSGVSEDNPEATRRSFPSGALRAEARSGHGISHDAASGPDASQEAELTRRTISTDPRGEPQRRKVTPLDERFGKASPSEEQSAYDLPPDPDQSAPGPLKPRRSAIARLRSQPAAPEPSAQVPAAEASHVVAEVEATKAVQSQGRTGSQHLKSWGIPALVAMFAIVMGMTELSVRSGLTALEPSLRQKSLSCQAGSARYADLRGRSWLGARSESIEQALRDRCAEEVDLVFKQYQTDNPGLKKTDWVEARANARSLLALESNQRYEAWENYAHGHVLRIENSLEEAISHYRRAAELDNFCDPYLALMHLFAYSKNQNLDQFLEAAQAAEARGCPPQRKHEIWMADIQYDEAERSYKRLDPKASPAEQLDAVERCIALYTAAKGVYQNNQSIGNAKNKLKTIRSRVNELEARRNQLQIRSLYFD